MTSCWYDISELMALSSFNYPPLLQPNNGSCATKPLVTQGHHIFPQSIWRKLGDLSTDIKKLFDKAVVEPASRHGWSKAHGGYNRIASKAWDEFCEASGKDLSEMNKEMGENFLRYLQSHPEINRFNNQVATGEPLTPPDENAPMPDLPPNLPPEFLPPEVNPTIPPEIP